MVTQDTGRLSNFKHLFFHLIHYSVAQGTNSVKCLLLPYWNPDVLSLLSLYLIKFRLEKKYNDQVKQTSSRIIQHPSPWSKRIQMKRKKTSGAIFISFLWNFPKLQHYVRGLSNSVQDNLLLWVFRFSLKFKWFE